MYLSCSTLVCPQDTYPAIRDAIRQIEQLCFRAIDVAAFEGWQNVDPSSLAVGDQSWPRDFAASVEEMGLEVSSLNCGPSKQLSDPDPASFAQYRREHQALLDLAIAVGCPNLTVQPGGVWEGLGFARSFDVSLKHLAELSSAGTDSGVSLSVEGHQGSLLEKPEDGVRLMEALWPAVGFTYDPSHFVMQGIPLKDTERLLDYTVHVHVRNASPGNMQATMDEACVDFAWLVSALRERDYKGAVTIEYFSGFDADFVSTLALRDLLLQLGVAS